MVERKRFATAIHFRNADRSEVAAVEAAVRDVAAAYPALVVTTGKEIFEYRPDFDWDKGKALEWLLDELGIEVERQVPIYLGDDTTDEDAFRSVRDIGVGIVVGSDGPQTLATFCLADTTEVERFLAQLAGEVDS
jgi:trehalose-phosphatase